MDIIEQLKPEVKYLLEEGEGCHDWDHTLRVYNLSLHIGRIEGADLEILGMAALLHDIGRPAETKLREEGEAACHAQIGAIMAEGLLQTYGVGQEDIEKVKHCILTHRYSGGSGCAYKKAQEEKEGQVNSKSMNPESKEAKILFDADKLDNIGAIGLARAFNYSGTYGARTHNPETQNENVRAYSREDTAYQYYIAKLVKIKDKLFTGEARHIAKERHKFMEEFFKRLNEECSGKK